MECSSHQEIWGWNSRSQCYPYNLEENRARNANDVANFAARAPSSDGEMDVKLSRIVLMTVYWSGLFMKQFLNTTKLCDLNHIFISIDNDCYLSYNM